MKTESNAILRAKNVEIINGGLMYMLLPRLPMLRDCHGYMGIRMGYGDGKKRRF